MYIYIVFTFSLALLQHGADSTIRNTDGKTAHDLAEPVAKSVLSGFTDLSYIQLSLHSVLSTFSSKISKISLGIS